MYRETSLDWAMTEAIYEDLLTYDQWWAEHRANACCSSAAEARARECGCGGSAAIPTGISRLLTDSEED